MFSALTNKITSAFGLFSGKSKLSESDVSLAVEKIEEALLDADVSFDIAKKISTQLKEKLVGEIASKNVSLEERVKTSLFNILKEIMGAELPFKFKKKSIILMLGLQGSGKTTSIGKLSGFLKEENKNYKILSTSVDFRRPAAIEQLRVLSLKNNFEFLAPTQGNIFESIKRAKEKFESEHFDFLFIDTPGRLHVENDLMSELKEISNSLNPDYKVLVIDSMTGQESINVARAFDQTVDISWSILSKTDSDSRGGVALSFFHEIKKPIHFIGTGEGHQDLERFISKRIASRIIGSGDIETLAEKVEKKINAEKRLDPEEMMKKLMSGKFDLKDFLSQIETMFSIGPVQKVLSYVPGLNSVPKEEMEKGEKEAISFKAIINSMTEKEQKNPSILDFSRKNRVARGSGKTVSDVENLLKKFNQAKQFAKMMASKYKFF